MDGEDLSRYDDVGKKQRDDREDTEALDQLEWELASQDGRVTGNDYCFISNYCRTLRDTILLSKQGCH